MGDNDTLYTVKEDHLAPYLYFHTNDRYSSEDNLEGYYPDLIFEGSNHILLYNVKQKVGVDDKGRLRYESVEPLPYIVDKNDYSTYHISNYSVDYLGYLADKLRISVSADRVAIIYEAIELRKIVNDVMNKKDAAPDLKERMSQLSESLSEEDNPYLLIGQIK